MTVWWEGLAPIETAGPDGAADHRLEWRDGELRLLAHPDPDAEAALGALGGDRCPCLDLLDAWHADHVTGTSLVVGARRPDERLRAPTAGVEQLVAELGRWRGARSSLLADARAEGNGDVVDRLTALRSPEEEAATRRLGGLLLLGLDPRLQHRLQASVAAELAGRAAATAVDPDAHALAALTVATAARALDPLRRIGWTGDLTAIHLGAEPSLSPDTAVLPASWTAAVWGRNLPLTELGELVVDVTSVTSRGELTVAALGLGKGQVVIRVVQWENA